MEEQLAREWVPRSVKKGKINNNKRLAHIKIIRAKFSRARASGGVVGMFTRRKSRSRARDHSCTAHSRLYKHMEGEGCIFLSTSCVLGTYLRASFALEYFLYDELSIRCKVEPSFCLVCGIKLFIAGFWMRAFIFYREKGKIIRTLYFDFVSVDETKWHWIEWVYCNTRLNLRYRIEKKKVNASLQFD